jgi:hypothetical protein
MSDVKSSATESLPVVNGMEPAESALAKIAGALRHVTTACLFLFAFGQPLSMAASHTFYAGAALAWLARLAIVRGRGLRGGPLDLPILIYLVLSAVSILMSPLPVSSWEGMRKVALVCLVIVVSQNVSFSHARRLVGVLLFSGLLTVGWTFWLYATGVGLRVIAPAPGSVWTRAGLQDRDVIIRVDGRRLSDPNQFLEYLRNKPAGEPLELSVVHWWNIEVSRNITPMSVPPGEWPTSAARGELGAQLETARPVRAFGFYSHYVTYAMVAMLLAALAFGLCLAKPWRSRLGRLTIAATFLALTLALGLTLTRAAWLALAIAFGVQIWIHFRHWVVRLLLPAAFALVLIAMSAAMVRWRGLNIIDLRDAGTDYRLLMWRDGLGLIGERPWFGVGMNSVRDAWWRFDLEAFEKYPLRSHFHSTPIQIAVEMGIPVLISWIALMAAYWFMLLRMVNRARQQKDASAYGLSLGILGGTAGFLASSLVHYDFGDSVVVFLFWFLAGIALVTWHHLEQRPGN